MAQKVLMALSGSTDCTIATAILRNQGYDVEAVHFDLGDRTPFEGYFLSDLEAARNAAKFLDIPLHEINAADAFEEIIKDYALHNLLQQKWPEVIVRFHQELLLKTLFSLADDSGCPYVATAHYAQVFQDSSSGTFRILKGMNAEQDQSFYFFGLTQQELQKLLLPLGVFSKEMVQKLGQELKLTPDQNRANEIYEPNLDLVLYVESRVAESLRDQGPIRTLENQMVAEHSGMHRYWMGKTTSHLDPLSKSFYRVVGFNQKDEAVIVGSEIHLLHKNVQLERVNWLRPVDQLRGMEASARLSPRDPLMPCRITHFENQIVHVEFEKTHSGLAPGKALAFVRGSELLGGGYIERLL